MMAVSDSLKRFKLTSMSQVHKQEGSEKSFGSALSKSGGRKVMWLILEWLFMELTGRMW